MGLSPVSLPGKLGGDDATTRPDIVDGFVLSMSQLYLPISYRANCLAQMEVLRKANGYQFMAQTAPSQAPETIPAFGQIEEQWTVEPGSYLWGWSLALVNNNIDIVNSGSIHVLITDACTETALSSDYILAANISSKRPLFNVAAPRNPFLLPQPRLISDPGKLNVEIYNNGGDISEGGPSEVQVQLICFFAQPIMPPPGIRGEWASR